MRPELDFNDPDTRWQRVERNSRLDSSPEEHAYLHKTIDEAVAELQTNHRHFIGFDTLIWLVLLTITVVLLWLR